MSEPLYLTLNVGEFPYKIKRDVLLAFPDSFFGKMLNSGWKEASEVIVVIQRSGELFKFVYDYIVYGYIPRNEFGIFTLGDRSLLKDILQEAKFYQLPGLVAECKRLLHTSNAEQRVKLYASVAEEIEVARSSAYGNCKVVYKTTRHDSLLSLLQHSSSDAPAWIRGKLRKDSNPTIFKSTTVQNVNVAELIAVAKPSPFGRGTETVLDTNVRNSVEIPASELGDLSEIVKNTNIHKLNWDMKLKLKPYKLVVYQEGGHFDDHRDTVRDKRHVGTLVVILKSEYTGGELVIYHGQRSVSVTGGLNWVAMYGDCVHTIRPITSGTRVSLIFDIYNDVSDDAMSVSKKDDEDDPYDNDVDYEDGFWPDNDFDTNFWLKENTTASVKTPESSEASSTCSSPGIRVNAWKLLKTPESSEASSTCSSPGIRVNAWKQLHAALDKELEKYKTVSICLQHLYPACQANPTFLKGVDAELYKMLKGKYSLGVTTITLARSVNHDERAKYVGYSEFGSDQLLDTDENILFVPDSMWKNRVLYSQTDITGNEKQSEAMVYLVATLVVSKQSVDCTV